MRLLSWLFQHGADPGPSGNGEGRTESIRLARIEWQGPNGEKVSVKALLQLDDAGGLRALVQQSPPPNSLAQVREKGSAYSVMITSTTAVDRGCELKLDFVGTGRRREERTRVDGQALLESEGLAAVEANVINISSGGMQVLAIRPANIGATIRVCGTEAEYLGVVRHCKGVPDGFQIGIQLFGENRRDVARDKGTLGFGERWY